MLVVNTQFLLKKREIFIMPLIVWYESMLYAYVE